MYVWCSDDPTPPCDQVNGNLIISGGHVNMHIVQVITANGGRPVEGGHGRRSGVKKMTTMTRTTKEPALRRHPAEIVVERPAVP